MHNFQADFLHTEPAKPALFLNSIIFASTFTGEVFEKKKPESIIRLEGLVDVQSTSIMWSIVGCEVN